MQRKDLYIGNPNQQMKLFRELSSDLKNERSGIYLVTSGIRVGKTKLINELEKSLGLRYSIPGYVEDYNQAFKEYRDAVNFNKIDAKNIILTTSEITDLNIEMLRALNDIVNSERQRGIKIKIVGEVVTKRFPAWNSEGNNKHILSIIQNTLKGNLVKTYPLDTDTKRLAEGVWTMIHSEHPLIWGETVEELGFPSSTSRFWEELPNVENRFVERLITIMSLNPNGSLEGSYRKRKESW